jgi:hypothetical protein
MSRARATSLVAITVLIVVCGVTARYAYRRHRVGRTRQLALNPSLPAGFPPASCAEWQTLSPPNSNPYPGYGPEQHCKALGGDNLCAGQGTLDRGGADHYGEFDIGPISCQTKVNHPITVYFRVRNLGSGDAVVYSFGKVDWGDNQQDQIPDSIFLGGVSLSHTYASQKTFVIHAMAGQQFKWSTPQVGGNSGSCEMCQDNSIPVTITP